MSKESNIRGVAKIEIGLPGDGVLGTSLTEFDGKTVVLNSLSFDGGDSSETTISTEGDDSYLTVGTGSTPPTTTFKLLEVIGADAVMILGGSYDAPSKTWDAPKVKPNKYLSVVITDLEGNKVIFPYAKVSGKHVGNITKSELLSLEIKATANTPVSAAGVSGAPYQIVNV